MFRTDLGDDESDPLGKQPDVEWNYGRKEGNRDEPIGDDDVDIYVDRIQVEGA